MVTATRRALGQTATPVIFRPYAQEDWAGLLRMYLTFEPKAAYQGLPPAKEVVTRRWLTKLVGNPHNTNLILRIEQEVIAHCALVYYPTHPGDEEIAIFVQQDHQHRGWGRKLFLAALNWACLRKGLQRVWLTVEWGNVWVRRLYERIGFVAASAKRLKMDDIKMQRGLQCATCIKTACPIFRSALMRMYLRNRAREESPQRLVRD